MQLFIYFYVGSVFLLFYLGEAFGVESHTLLFTLVQLLALLPVFRYTML